MANSILHALQDRYEIEECLSRYAHGVDRHDEALIAQVYHADASDWHGPYSGGVAEFVTWVNALHERKTRAHTHNITTHWCDVRGDRAFSDTYVIFVLYRREREIVMMGSGRYVDRLERRDGVWRIAQRRTIIDIRLEADAQSLARSPGNYPSGTWDRSDPSYQRPLQLPTHSVAPVPMGMSTIANAETLLSECAARRSIRDCITQSVRGLDRNDRELVLVQYAPGARVMDGAFHGDVVRHTDELLRRFEAEDLALAHHLTSQRIELRGESDAAAETYLMLMRYSKHSATVWVGGIRLLDRLELDEGRWQITSRQMVADFELEADGSALATDDQYPRSRRNGEDISYERV